MIVNCKGKKCEGCLVSYDTCHLDKLITTKNTIQDFNVLCDCDNISYVFNFSKSCVETLLYKHLNNVLYFNTFHIN